MHTLKHRGKRKTFGYNFAARAAVCYFLILFLLLSCIVRVAVIDSQGLDLVCARQSEYRIKVKQLRGTVYDANMLPLTNNKKSTVAVALPTPGASVAVSSVLPENERQSFLDKLREGKPTVWEVPKKVSADGVATADVYKTEGSTDACHIIGYLDSTGHGAAGIEAAYDQLLCDGSYLCAVVETDGKGRPLCGTNPRFGPESGVQANSVVLTVDMNMQKAVSEAAKNITRGAAVLSEVKTGEIKALVSLPQFDTANISESLNNEDSPFINRALRAYSVGSVFKTCVAAAGIENGFTDERFNCSGSEYIVDRYFKCHNLSGHGLTDLRHALAYSCNCFFYNYAKKTGGEPIYSMARKLNFGFPLKIADNLKTEAGTLPRPTDLNNPALLANFSIGQGSFSASPISLLSLYTAIANGGRYCLPSVVKRTVKDGKSTQYNKGKPTVAMSKKTADTIKEYLKDVITEGTAAAASPKTVSAAGKTATAQTGRVDKAGQKINNSWFCGFFPAEEPEYVAVVLSEDGNTTETAATFSRIADSINKIVHGT